MARPKRLLDSEKKTARISLLIRPQLRADLITLAVLRKISVNDLLTRLAEQVVEKNQAEIDSARAILNTVAPNISFELDHTRSG